MGFSFLVERKALCLRNAFWRGLASESGVSEVKVESGEGDHLPGGPAAGDAKRRLAAKRKMETPELP